MNNNPINAVLNYDGIAKRTLQSLKDDVIINFINITFSKNFDSNAKVIRMATESYNAEIKQKRCDYFININNEMFLIEIQSYDDNEMAVRIFDYGVRGAILHSKNNTGEDIVDLNLAEPAVFYLRKGNKPHETLKLRLTKQSGGEFIYEARVIYLDDYSFSEMIDKYMFPMIPFYPMRYEKILFSSHTDQDEKTILADIIDCNRRLKQTYKDGIISSENYKHIRDWFINVFKEIIRKARNRNTLINEQEAENIMNMIVDEPIEGFDLYQALEDSKEEGRNEGKNEMIIKMLEKGIPIDVISDCSGVSADEIENLKAGSVTE